MQREEKHRAIEAQKKKMEALSAWQHLKLGKAAFLHVIKKGKADASGCGPLNKEIFLRENSVAQIRCRNGLISGAHFS
uniref:Uncharacterized protein n=1 Tax=Mus spicilegus TaxID=10103 RepID=A0A8C6IKK3_MUSSI